MIHKEKHFMYKFYLLIFSMAVSNFCLMAQTVPHQNKPDEIISCLAGT